MSHEQLNFFEEIQPTEQPNNSVDIDGMAERIAAHARYEGGPDRASEAARDQGFGSPAANELVETLVTVTKPVPVKVRRAVLGSAALAAEQRAAAPSPDPVRIDKVGYDNPAYSQGANRRQYTADRAAIRAMHRYTHGRGSGA